MKISGWGNYPQIDSNSFNFDNDTDLRRIINENNELIAFGNGRSYGDSALNKNIINVKPHNHFIHFDAAKGLLHLQAGVLLSEILDVFVPRGWFLKITPGTKWITVGGAIASDVHGKNHHADGCFSECVDMFNLMLSNGEIVTCSPTENAELFKATCGGMGLTGIILDTKIYLKKINSRYIDQTTIKTKNLQETFEAFQKYKDSPYSVAWIDCLTRGNKMGRSILTVGDFSNDGNLDYHAKRTISIPLYMPSFLMNIFTIKMFNRLYYGRILRKVSKQKVTLDTFFYPLDAIGHWNRIYGKKGFTQYQFVLPEQTSYDGLEEILKVISGSGKGSFINVLKLCGKANANYLSFPLEGYSLALDFKVAKGIFELLDRLDDIVLKYGGRLYLTKDSRVSRDVFEKGYPHIEQFRAIRKKNKMNEKFNSLQSKRLGL